MGSINVLFTVGTLNCNEQYLNDFHINFDIGELVALTRKRVIIALTRVVRDGMILFRDKDEACFYLAAKKTQCLMSV